MTMHAQLYGCFLKDDVYLSLCLQNFRRGSDNSILVGALPFKVKTQVRFIHGNELNQDLVRILIAQKKQIVTIVEVHKIPETNHRTNEEFQTANADGSAQRSFGTPFKARFRNEWYQLDLSLPSVSKSYQEALLEDDDDCYT